MRNQASMADLVKNKGNRKALCFTLELVAGQQLCGINAVLFNSQTIFENAGGSLDSAVATIIIGVVMFVASGCTPIVVDRLGRKILLHISAVGMILGLVSTNLKLLHLLPVYIYL